MDKTKAYQPERVVLSECLIELSRLGHRGFRNNTGLLYDKNGHPVKFGLCVGSGDIIGIHNPSGRLISIECKATGKRIKPNSPQDKWRKMVIAQGGIAFECDDARKLKKLLDEHA